MNARSLAGLTALAVVAAPGTGPQAQEAGRVSTAFINSELEVNDNFDLREDSAGTATILDTTLGAGLERRTRVDEFTLNASGILRAADLPVTGTEATADAPNVGLTYERAVEDNALSFGANFRRNDLDFFDPLTDIDDDGRFDETATDGTRQSIRANGSVELNTDGPVSFTGSANYRQVTFSDLSAAQEADEDFEDRERADVAGEFGFRVSPVLTLTTGASYAADLFDRDGTDREAIRADIGANARLNPRMDARVRLGYSEVETLRNDEDEETETGFVGDFGLIVAEPNGETRVNLGSTLDENGERVSLTVGRTRTTDTTELDGDIGVSTSADTDVNVVGEVDYVYTLRNTQVAAGFRQVNTVDEDGNNVLNTSASLGLTQAITRLSRFNVEVAGGLRRNLDEDDDDDSRINFTASYSRDITRDWSWNFGYRGRYRDEDEDGDGVYRIALTFPRRALRTLDAEDRAVWSLTEDLSAYPTYRSDQRLVDALYNLSLEEMRLDVREDGAFMAGKKWTGVWTRDISYSILLSLAAIEPEGAKRSLLHKVTDDGRIIQDTGTGGSPPGKPTSPPATTTGCRRATTSFVAPPRPICRPPSTPPPDCSTVSLRLWTGGSSRTRTGWMRRTSTSRSPSAPTSFTTAPTEFWRTWRRNSAGRVIGGRRWPRRCKKASTSTCGCRRKGATPSFATGATIRRRRRGPRGWARHSPS